MKIFGKRVTKTTLCVYAWFISGLVTTVFFYLGKMTASDFQTALIAISTFWGMAGLKVAGDKSKDEA